MTSRDLLGLESSPSRRGDGWRSEAFAGQNITVRRSAESIMPQRVEATVIPNFFRVPWPKRRWTKPSIDRQEIQNDEQGNVIAREPPKFRV